jgi:hypothetical protein
LKNELATSERWRRNRAVVGPVGAVEVDLPRSRARRELAAEKVAALPAGTPVVLCAAGAFARRRCRRFAHDVGIEVRREYLALPSAAAPAYLIDDAPQPIRVFIEHALVAPPGVRVSLSADLGVAFLRSFTPTRFLRLVAPGRVVVGRLK